MSVTVFILPHKKTVSFEKNALLLDAIQKAGIPIRSDCNKLGLCGKCRVNIVEGVVSPPGPQEKTFLNENDLKNNCRLACQARIQTPLTAEIPEESLVRDQTILKTGLEMDVRPDPAVKKFCIHLPKQTISRPISILELIQDVLRIPRLITEPSCLKNIPSPDIHEGKLSVVIHRNREILSIEAGNTVDRCFGLAIDLGTTTLVLDLIDLNTGTTIDSAVQENTQGRYGSDVISRGKCLISSASDDYSTDGVIL